MRLTRSTRRLPAAVLLTLVVAVAVGPTSPGVADGPSAHAAATCADHPNQAAAQRAGDTRDADGDGVYCESLPCPCAGPGNSNGGGSGGSKPAPRKKTSCIKPRTIQRITFSKTKYANIKRHYDHAIARGWPRTLVLNRPGADARRGRLLENYPTKPGMDRDEYPPAIGRGKGKGLAQGSNPRGWKADVEYVPSSENRSHGSTMGVKLRRFCNGTRFRYVFY